jgi:hypothetical protein
MAFIAGFVAGTLVTFITIGIMAGADVDDDCTD